MNFELIKINNPKNYNIIFGQSHFIKTVEDLHEALVSAVPNIKFGLAFAEASGPCLIRKTSTCKRMENLAVKNLKKIGAGHSFLIFMRESFPINVLNRIKNCSEVCQIFCATANPLEVIIAQTEQGRAVIGVADGGLPKGVEKEKDIKQRKKFLRKIGYKSR
jgi:adenosine/AMP kinase